MFIFILVDILMLFLIFFIFLLLFIKIFFFNWELNCSFLFKYGFDCDWVDFKCVKICGRFFRCFRGGFFVFWIVLVLFFCDSIIGSVIIFVKFCFSVFLVFLLFRDFYFMFMFFSVLYIVLRFCFFVNFFFVLLMLCRK